jgi:hypothetical protein
VSGGKDGGNALGGLPSALVDSLLFSGAVSARATAEPVPWRGERAVLSHAAAATRRRELPRGVSRARAGAHDGAKPLARSRNARARVRAHFVRNAATAHRGWQRAHQHTRAVVDMFGADAVMPAAPAALSFCGTRFEMIARLSMGE